MINSKSIFVVIPCYNEAPDVLRDTLLPLIALKYSLVLVDDGSALDIFSGIKDLDVYYLRHQINLGQGAALQTGVSFSLMQNADIIIHFDADGQHNSEDIANFIHPLLSNSADVVLGSRFLRKEDIKAVPFFRRGILRVARFVNGLVTGLWLSDAHNGFRALTRNAAQKIYLTENRHAHASEILYQIKTYKIRFVEQPTHIVYTAYSRFKGQTSLNSINVFMDLILNKIFK